MDLIHPTPAALPCVWGAGVRGSVISPYVFASFSTPSPFAWCSHHSLPCVSRGTHPTLRQCVGFRAGPTNFGPYPLTPRTQLRNTATFTSLRLPNSPPHT
eukprot:Hpha_TRINITY_DN15419_c0_g3::TRINITY_DN15419_c0_g3_i1::g.177415::m.177415